MRCETRERLESEWVSAVNRASELERRQHRATVEEYRVESDLSAKIRKAYANAEEAQRALDVHRERHGCG